MQQKNGKFKSSLGFILASVGSAVGLGNIWMFPYRLGQYGGAAFLIPYLFFVALFGAVGLSAEFAIGRRAGTGTLGAYALCWQSESKKKSSFGKLMGWIPLLGSLGIAIGYSIIIGWVLRSLAGAVSGSLFAVPSGEFFARTADSHFAGIPWHIAVILITMILLLLGSAPYIEKANKIMMPVFFLLFAVLAVRTAFLPGSGDGYRFLLVPDWNCLKRVDTWVMAMGQAFFSLSITGSGMIVYGSYLDKKENILKSSLFTAGFDTLAALLAAFALMPAAFAFGIAPDRGPSLMFVTIPNMFAQMPAGRFFAVLFFLSVLFAGITSLLNMFEAVAESLQNRFGIRRRFSVLLCCGLSLLVGLFLEKESAVGGWMDAVTILIVPFGAVFGAVSIYYIFGGKRLEQEMNIGRTKPIPKWFIPVGKWIYVPLTVLVFFLGLIYKGIG